MKKILISVICFVYLVLISYSPSFGQDEQVVKIEKKPLKNTIRFNLTSPIFFGENYIVFGYERVVNSKQTFSVNLGRFSIPKFTSTDSDIAELNKDYKDRGINTSADYRFYLNALNNYEAPRGVYVGPYYSYNYFKRENTWTLSTDLFVGEAGTDLILNIHTAGLQLGYQFVFWRRLAVDFVLFGPGIGYYGIKSELRTSLEPDDEALLFEKINDLLAEKFPGYNFAIEKTLFESKGSFKTTSLGFRYMIHIGFRF
ncbi:MAG: DUF3575 domain-containing protein [Bacteroidales bacterium]